MKSTTQKNIFALTEEDCLEMLEKIRWKNGVSCPYCGKSDKIIKNGKDDSCGVDAQRYMCNHCGNTFNVKTKTIFEDSKIPLQKWFIMIALLGTNSLLNISELLNVAYSTAYRMAKKIRSVISTEENKRTFYGKIMLEIDEMYVTSGEKGKKDLDREPRKRGLKSPPGRGTFAKDKPPIVTFVDRNTKQTLFFVPQNLSKEYIREKISQHTDEDSEITAHTDEYKIYSGLEKFGYKHETVDHSVEYVNGNVHINNCENRHSLLKPFLLIRRGVSKDNLQSYVTLFQFYFNIRLQSHNYIEIVAKVIAVIINFLRFLLCLKNWQFLT